MSGLPTFEESLERDERALERIAVAFETLASVASAWYKKEYPEKPEPKDATISRIPTDTDELKEAQGYSEERIEEWIGIREQAVIDKNLSKVPSGKEETPRRESALSRIGVTQSQLNLAPDITSILKETRGGIKLAFKAMRFSESPLIRSFLEKYDALPEGDNDRIPIEAIAIAAKIDVRHLWGEIMLAIREQSVSSVKIIAVAAHPDIIKSRVEFAKTPGGFRDRDALDTMLGALPSPKGPTFINKFFASGARDTEEQPEQVDEMVDDLDYTFPDCSVMQEKVQPMRQKALTTGK